MTTDERLGILSERDCALRVQAQRCDAARESWEARKAATREAKEVYENEQEALLDMARDGGPLFADDDQKGGE